MYSIVNYFLRNALNIYACKHPNPQFMVGYGRNVHLWHFPNVRAETSWAEMSVAEMSYIRFNSTFISTAKHIFRFIP